VTSRRLDPDLLSAFKEGASLASAELHAGDVASSWTEPSALEGYSVGGLAAHLPLMVERALQLLVGAETEGVSVDLVGFYGPNRREPGDPLEGLAGYLVTIAEEAASAGPEAVASRFDAAVTALEAVLEEASPERRVPVLQVPGGTTSVVTYLRTRIVELVVHADDLAASAGRRLELTGSEAAAETTIGVLVEMARGRVGDGDFIRALTRRERVAPGSVVVF